MCCLISYECKIMIEASVLIFAAPRPLYARIPTFAGVVKHRLLIKPTLAHIMVEFQGVILHTLWKFNEAFGQSRCGLIYVKVSYINMIFNIRWG